MSINQQEQLRAKAELELARAPDAKQMPRPSEKLLHELRVQQIELEMQNEELRKAQIVIEESRDRYADLYDFAPIAYLTLTQEKMIAEINLTGAAMLRKERTKLVGHRFAKFIPLEEHERWHQFLDTLTHQNEKQCIELNLQRSDGSRFCALLDCMRVEGGHSPVLIAFTDITLRKQADEALRNSGQKYQLLFESSRDALMLLAPPSWRFTGANRATLELFGASNVAQFTSICPWEVSPERQPDGRLSSEKALEMIAIAMNNGSHFFEWEHQRPDGLKFSADVLLSRMNVGNEVFLQATVRDITDRKQATRAAAEAQVIAENEEKFRKITESVQDAIIMMGADKCISLWNPAAQRIFGYTAEEALGKEMHPLITPNGATEAFERGFVNFLKTGTGPVIGKTHELSAVRKGGEEFPVEVTISALQVNSVWNAIGIFRDITERRFAEQKIHNYIAEQTVMMREIHHRVKNNLQMISALLELQSGYIKDEQALGYFRDSQQRIQSMAIIHEQLYRNQNFAQVDFVAYLHSLVDNLRIQYGERCKQINIRIDATACTLPVDTAIPCGLVLNELITNAMKHAFPNGRAGLLNINLKNNGENKIILEVADDGVGMPTGLDIRNSNSFGLKVITLMIEKQLHGRLTMESHVGHGTRVVCETGISK